MPRTRPPYPPEFREQMVELVKAGRTPEELSREFEPTAVLAPPDTNASTGTDQDRPPVSDASGDSSPIHRQALV